MKDKAMEIAGIIVEAQLNAVEADRGIKQPVGEKYYVDKILSLPTGKMIDCPECKGTRVDARLGLPVACFCGTGKIPETIKDTI